MDHKIVLQNYIKTQLEVNRKELAGLEAQLGEIQAAIDAKKIVIEAFESKIKGDDLSFDMPIEKSHKYTNEEREAQILEALESASPIGMMAYEIAKLINEKYVEGTIKTRQIYSYIPKLVKDGKAEVTTASKRNNRWRLKTQQ